MCVKLMIKTKQAIYAMPVDRIVFMEKDLRKVILYTKKDKIEFYGKLTDIVGMLDDRFMHCHRSYVINMDEIFVMADNEICMSNGSRILFGRDRFYKAKKIFKEYMAEKNLKSEA